MPKTMTPTELVFEASGIHENLLNTGQALKFLGMTGNVNAEMLKKRTGIKEYLKIGNAYLFAVSALEAVKPKVDAERLALRQEMARRNNPNVNGKAKRARIEAIKAAPAVDKAATENIAALLRNMEAALSLRDEAIANITSKCEQLQTVLAGMVEIGKQQAETNKRLSKVLTLLGGKDDA